MKTEFRSPPKSSKKKPWTNIFLYWRSIHTNYSIDRYRFSEQLFLDEPVGRLADCVPVRNRVHFRSVGQPGGAVRVHSYVKSTKSEKQVLIVVDFHLKQLIFSPWRSDVGVVHQAMTSANPFRRSLPLDRRYLIYCVVQPAVHLLVANSFFELRMSTARRASINLHKNHCRHRDANVNQ